MPKAVRLLTIATAVLTAFLAGTADAEDQTPLRTTYRGISIDVPHNDPTFPADPQERTVFQRICLAPNESIIALASDGAEPHLSVAAGATSDTAMPEAVWDSITEAQWDEMRRRGDARRSEELKGLAELVQPSTLEKRTIDSLPGSLRTSWLRSPEFEENATFVLKRWEVVYRGAGADGTDRILIFCMAYPIADGVEGHALSEKLIGTVSIDRAYHEP